MCLNRLVFLIEGRREGSLKGLLEEKSRSVLQGKEKI